MSLLNKWLWNAIIPLHNLKCGLSSLWISQVVRGKEFAYGWFTSKSDRKQKNSVKQLSFNKEKKKRIRLPVQETQEMKVWSLGWKDLLEWETATCPSISAWKIPWTEEPGRLQSTGSQRVRHNPVSVHTCACMRAHTHTHAHCSLVWTSTKHLVIILHV